MKFFYSGVADDKELNFCIEDIAMTAFLVESATFHFKGNSEKVKQPQMQSIEAKYLEVMKGLQFGKFPQFHCTFHLIDCFFCADSIEMIQNDSNEFSFTIDYHYESIARTNGTQGSATRIKRLAQEHASLPNSLPLSFSSSIFVRSDTSRMDMVKFLITGPANTPYENGCFIFDVYFPPEYPNEPPQVNFQTTGGRTIRFNPNLYPCGKVCLSLLNTWTGQHEGKWDAKTSTFLQVLVSIQSMILVDDPYFNEPLCQGSQSAPEAELASRSYNQNLYYSTIKWAMVDLIRNPIPCFKDVIQKHFWLKRNDIMVQVEKWEKESKSLAFSKSELAREFLKLQVPVGLEKYDIDTPEMNRDVLLTIANEKVRCFKQPGQLNA